MRHAILTILVLLVLGASVSAVPLQAATGGAAAAPVAFFPETEHTFSAVVEGTPVVHDFVIRNTGTAELKIKRVDTG